MSLPNWLTLPPAHCQYVCMRGVLWPSSGEPHQEGHRSPHPWQDETQTQQDLCRFPSSEEVSTCRLCTHCACPTLVPVSLNHCPICTPAASWCALTWWPEGSISLMSTGCCSTIPPAVPGESQKLSPSIFSLFLGGCFMLLYSSHCLVFSRDVSSLVKLRGWGVNDQLIHLFQLHILIY